MLDFVYDIDRSRGRFHCMSTMFERYGGFGTVSKIVMSFYDKVLDSDIAGPYFDDVDVKALIDHQTKFIAQVMGGPVAYTNEKLRTVHAKHNIDRAAFDEVAGLLEETLEDFEMDPADIKEIIGNVASRMPYVVSA